MTVTLSNVVKRWGAGSDGTPNANRALHASFQGIATILRKSIVSDGAGGQVDTYTSVATAACNFERSMVRPREVEYAELIRNLSYWDFHFVPGLDVRTTDRIQINGRTFEVIGRGLGSSTVVLVIITMEIL